jgi:hypothetical protein
MIPANKTSVLKIVLLFVGSIIAIRFIQNLVLENLFSEGTLSYETDNLVRTGFNILYVLLAYFLIKKYQLFGLAGLKSPKLKNWYFLLFPLYIALLNIPDDGEVLYAEIPAIKYILLAIYVFSVGVSEEYLLRGFLQSFLLKHYGTTKKGIVFSVIGAAFIFGLLHLLNFDKGLYGEIGQVCFATFIGVMFGAILLRTQKLYPLIIIHAIIDFVAKLDDLTPLSTLVEETAKTPAGIGDTIVIILLTLPCFIYGLILLRKFSTEDLKKLQNYSLVK